MKKKLSVVCALVLSVVMTFSCILPCFAAALPSGVTSSEALSALPKLETLLKTLLSQNEMTADLNKTVYGLLFSDGTLNSLLTGVYSLFAENESTISGIGLDISPSAVARELQAYPEVYEYLMSKQSWSEISGAQMTCKWNVNDRDGFKYAVAGMFGPLNPLLYTLLCGGRYKVNSFVFIDGAKGYQTAIVPLLNALGCPSVMSQEDFSAQANENRYLITQNIAAMLFASVDNILSSPLSKLCEILPGLAYFMQSGGVSSALETLITPLKVRVGIFNLSGLDKILESTGMLSDAGSLNDMFGDIDLSALTGGEMKLQLPEFDLAALAACGTVSESGYIPDKAAALCEIMRWVIELARLNKNELTSLLGADIPASFSGVLDGFLAKSDDELIKLIFDILNMSSEDTVLEYEWQYPAFTPGTVTYTPNLGEAEYTKVLAGIDDTLNEFLSEFGDGSLSSTLAQTVYSGKTVTAIVKALYGALYSEETAELLGMLGLDASTESIAKVISGSFPSAARSISAALKWENVKEDVVSWGFASGNRQGFEKALITALKPLSPFLDLLLAEGETDILDIIKLKGSNGYNTAVIPLLEALGCGDIRAYAQYKAVSGTDEALKYILDPICGLLDSLIEDPVLTICQKLPNIVYFVNSGGIKQCIDNLLYPVNVLLKKFGLEDMLPAELKDIGNIDVSRLITQLSENGTLPFKLPAPDLSLLGSLGTAERYDSKRTYKGLYASYTYIKADAPAVLITVLRYIIGALSDPANGDGLSSLMGGASDSNDMFAMYMGNITEQFKTMTTDEIIEWLYNLLFRETPKKEIVEKGEEYIPTIIYEPEEDHTALIRGLLIAAAVVLPTLLVIYLAKRDVADKKERKQRKKLKKKAAKEAARAKAKTSVKKEVNAQAKIKASSSVPVNSSGEKTTEAGIAENTAERGTDGRVHAKSKVPAELPEKKPKVRLKVDYKSISVPEEAPVRATEGETPVKTEKTVTEKEKPQQSRESVKVQLIKTKAVNKALRDAKKADKYYEKAMKQGSSRK